MQAFEYARPATVAGAAELLARYGDDARILAGGTDLIVALRQGTVRPRVVVDVKGLTDLPPAVSETAGAVSVGAGAVMADLVSDPRIRASFPALVDAMDVVGSIQIRNRATLAGNVCNASPAADTLSHCGLKPALMYSNLSCSILRWSTTLVSRMYSLSTVP